MDLQQHILKITKSVIDDNQVYHKFIKRYLLWMKLSQNQIADFTQHIVSNVEKRLDKIIEIPIINMNLEEFETAWFTNLGFESEEDLNNLDQEEEVYMNKIWELATNIKHRFPKLSTANDVRDFAKIEIYDYVNNVLETKELNKHLMSYIEDFVEERSN